MDETYVPLPTADAEQFYLTLLARNSPAPRSGGIQNPEEFTPPIEPPGSFSESVFVLPGPEVPVMPDLDDRAGWQRHVMQKNFELSNSPDVDVAAKALDRIAKTSVAALYEDRVQVNVDALSREQIQDRLLQLADRILGRTIGGHSTTITPLTPSNTPSAEPESLTIEQNS